MRNYEELKTQLLQNPIIKEEYEALEPEFQVIKAIVEARKYQHLTQEQLSERTGINRSDLSKIENGNANPSLKTLKRIASGMDMKIKIEFIPR